MSEWNKSWQSDEMLSTYNIPACAKPFRGVYILFLSAVNF